MKIANGLAFSPKLAIYDLDTCTISCAMKSTDSTSVLPKTAAGMFLRFLSQPENASVFSAAIGYIPVCKSADTTKLFEKLSLTKIAV